MRIDEGDAASGGDSNYATDIKPWLNGPVFLSGDATTLAAAESAPDGEGATDGTAVPEERAA